LGEFGEEVRREVRKIAGGSRDGSFDTKTEMIGTETGLGFQAGAAAALAIGKAMQAAGRVQLSPVKGLR
jgi:hypothetical protein